MAFIKPPLIDDPDYPTRLITKLVEQAPPLIYGCGDNKLLDKIGLAVVGSRDADEQSLNFTESVGQLAASAGVNIISGGAKGVDRAAMWSCLIAGGTAVGVLSNNSSGWQWLQIAANGFEKDGWL